MKLVKEINYQDARMKMLTNNRDDFFVDVNIERLSEILGYESKNGVEVIMNRNQYLKTREFSRLEKAITNGGIQESRLSFPVSLYSKPHTWRISAWHFKNYEGHLLRRIMRDMFFKDEL